MSVFLLKISDLEATSRDAERAFSEWEDTVDFPFCIFHDMQNAFRMMKNVSGKHLSILGLERKLELMRGTAARI